MRFTRPPTFGRSRSWRPTSVQELLLVAALGRDALAVEHALASWLHHARGKPLDAGSQRLLPLLDHNLRAWGLAAADAEAWQAQAVQTWCDNQILFHEAGDILARFHRAGVETRVLKGAALTMLVYQDAGLRPMTDVDILVPIERACEAMGILADAGWLPEYSRAAALIPYQHAVSFTNASGGRCDLHWQLLADGRQDAGDAAYWQEPVAFELGGVPALALSPADQLLHTCVHGALWNGTPTVRWVADVAWTLRVLDGSIDWSALVRRVEERGLVSPVQATLAYVQRLLGAPIPGDVFARIQELRAPFVDRLVHRCRSSPAKTLRAVGRLQYWIRRWRASDAPVGQRGAEFCRYLRTVS